MSGSGRRPTAADHHLGDRLAALIDGELSHESRERVLAHLATCRTCKIEADAQRKVKSVFADTAPPAPSDGLLARLQGLPGGAHTDRGGDDRQGRRTAGRKPASPQPSRRFPPVDLMAESGFRIHEMERSGSRGRRFAFVAAGAFSLAALAVGGALSPEATGGATASPTTAGAPAAGSVRSDEEGGAPLADRLEGGSPITGRGATDGAAIPPVSTTDYLAPLFGTTMALTPPLVRPSIPHWRLGATPRRPERSYAQRTPSARPSAESNDAQPLVADSDASPARSRASTMASKP